MNIRRPGKSSVEYSMKATPSHQDGWLAKITSGRPASSGGGSPHLAIRTARRCFRAKPANMKR